MNSSAIRTVRKTTDYIFVICSLFLGNLSLITAQGYTVRIPSSLPPIRMEVNDSSFYDLPDLYLAFTLNDLSNLTNELQQYANSTQIVPLKQPDRPVFFSQGILNYSLPYGGSIHQNFGIHEDELLAGAMYYFSTPNSLYPGSGYRTYRIDPKIEYLNTFTGADARGIDIHSLEIADSKYHYMVNGFHEYPLDSVWRTALIPRYIISGETGPILREIDLFEAGAIYIDSIPYNKMVNGDGAIAANGVYDAVHKNHMFVTSDLFDGKEIMVVGEPHDGIKFIDLADTSVYRYGASSSYFQPSDAADHSLTDQHCPILIENGIYKDSSFIAILDNRGQEEGAEGVRLVVLDFNLELKSVRMVREVAFPDIRTVAYGNVSFIDKYVLINTGAGVDYFFKDQLPNWILYDLELDKTIANYFLPRGIFAYEVWLTDKEIKLPELSCNDSTIKLDGLWQDPVWSNGSTGISTTDLSVSYVSVAIDEYSRLISWDVPVCDSTITSSDNIISLIQTFENDQIILRTIDNGPKSAEIYTSSGSLLKKFDFTGNEIQISLKNYVPDVYVLVCKFQDGTRAVKSLVHR